MKRESPTCFLFILQASSFASASHHLEDEECHDRGAKAAGGEVDDEGLARGAAPLRVGQRELARQGKRSVVLSHCVLPPCRRESRRRRKVKQKSYRRTRLQRGAGY